SGMTRTGRHDLVRPTTGGHLSPQEWFEALRAQLPGEIAPLDEAEEQALLDLARVGAHPSERWVAPLSTYLAGLAVAETPTASRAQVLRQLVDTLEE
ncbi:MAG: DUF6457 domain-containing protein, partial [Actinomycetota bacterium]